MHAEVCARPAPAWPTTRPASGRWRCGTPTPRMRRSAPAWAGCAPAATPPGPAATAPALPSPPPRSLPEETPMTNAITQETERCWVLRLPSGAEPDHGAWPDSHYTTEEAAAKDAAELRDNYDPPRVLVPVRLATPCWSATAACGYRYDQD